MYLSGDDSFLLQQTKGAFIMETPFVLEMKFCHIFSKPKRHKISLAS